MLLAFHEWHGAVAAKPLKQICFMFVVCNLTAKLCECEEAHYASTKSSYFIPNNLIVMREISAKEDPT